MKGRERWGLAWVRRSLQSHPSSGLHSDLVTPWWSLQACQAWVHSLAWREDNPTFSGAPFLAINKLFGGYCSCISQSRESSTEKSSHGQWVAVSVCGSSTLLPWRGRMGSRCWNGAQWYPFLCTFRVQTSQAWLGLTWAPFSSPLTISPNKELICIDLFSFWE